MVDYDRRGQPLIMYPTGDIVEAIEEREAPDLSHFRKMRERPEFPYDVERGYAQGEYPQEGYEVQGPTQGAAPNRSLYGRTVRVPGNVGINNVAGIQIPYQEEEQDWMIVIQATNTPIHTGDATPGLLFATIQWGVGEATFTKIYQISNVLANRIPITASALQVTLTWSGHVGATKFIDVNLAVSKGHDLAPAGYFAPTWGNAPGTNAGGAMAAFYSLTQAGQRGILLSASAQIVTAPPATPVFYIAFYDFAPAMFPPPGTVPIPGGVSPPIVAAPAGVQFDDEFAPAIGFVDGLFVAMTSTPDVLTFAPGGTFHIDFKFGS